MSSTGPNQAFKRALMASAALLLLADRAAAQSGPGNDPNATPSGQLEEVVVTATRQTDTVNRVPLSITAETQRSLDQRGVRVINDLQGTVPALAITGQSNPSLANVAIRGISDLGLGAATTGFYLDDTPIQKRNVGGAFSGNGTPLPPLFDLDRVEVLRGPQGTLFGGSSEGGTIRYITPTPSLTRYSEYIKAEASTTRYGGPSYEGGVAIGGPIIPDKLAFRVSYDDRHNGGFVDYLNRVTQQIQFKDANSGDTQVLRAALLWSPVENARITLGYFESHDHYKSAYTGYSPPITNALVANPVCFNTTGVTKAAPGIKGVGAANCAALTAAGQVTYTRPGFTYGPYPNLGPGTTVAQQTVTPSTVNLYIPTLTLEYDFAKMNVKAITSYIYDEDKQQSTDGPSSMIRDAPDNITYGAITIQRQFTSIGQLPYANLVDGISYTNNHRRGVTQEVRFSSAGDAKPLSWVGGIYYSNFRGTQAFDNTYKDFDLLNQLLYGFSGTQRYGVPAYSFYGQPIGVDAKRQRLKDVEIAGFGEANYWVTDKLRLTAGVRYSRVSFDYEEVHFGPYSFFNTPTTANGGGPNTGSVTESPITPKFAAQYSFTDNDLVYASASKGFRSGGVNGNLPEAICSPGFAQYGLTTASLPVTYKSDTVWSYEAGGKFRVLNNRVQLNGDVYRIDWNNPQLSVNVGLACPAFTANAGKARSQGFELEAQARLIEGVTGNIAIGYTDAKYIGNAVSLPGGNPPLYSAFDGQHIAVPPLTFQVGLRYDLMLGGLNTYIRGDWRYIKHYSNTLAQVYSFGGFANNNFAPDNIYPDTNRLNLRAGVELHGFDINAFVNNVFDNEKGVVSGGRGSCATPSAGGSAACSTFVTYNPFFSVSPASYPRQVGIQIAYRH